MPLDADGKVCIDPGETVQFHITAWRRARVNVAARGAPRPIFKNALVLDLDEVDGEMGSFEYRVTSEKLAANILPLLDTGVYKDRTVVLHAEGEGFSRVLEYSTGPRGVAASPYTSAGPVPAWAVSYAGGGVYVDGQGRGRTRMGVFASLPVAA